MKPASRLILARIVPARRWAAVPDGCRFLRRLGFTFVLLSLLLSFRALGENEPQTAAEPTLVILSQLPGREPAARDHLSVTDGEMLTLSVPAELAADAAVQWFRNRNPIPGATNTALVLARVHPTNDLDLFHVVVTSHIATNRAELVLHVSQDTVPPAVLSVLNLGDGRSLAVCFSKAVDPGSASIVENYSIDGAPVERATVSADPTVALVRSSHPLLHPRHLRVANVRDRAHPPNVMGPGDHEIEPGLRAWLQFERVNGEETPDASGHGRSARLVGNPQWHDVGRDAGCLVLDGVDDHAVLPAGMADFVGGLTVTVWARPASVKRWARFIDFANKSNSDNILFGRYSDTTAIFFEVYPGDQVRAKVIAEAAIELNRWQHFAASMEPSGRVSIYKNGALIASGTVALPRVVVRRANFVGRSHWGPEVDDYYEGALDELRIYDRPLSATEIRALAGAGHTP